MINHYYFGSALDTESLKQKVNVLEAAVQDLLAQTPSDVRERLDTCDKTNVLLQTHLGELEAINFEHEEEIVYLKSAVRNFLTPKAI